MRRWFLILGVLFAACGGSDATPPNNTPTSVDVFTAGNVFSPFTVTIPTGGVVNFNISGSPEGHDVTFDKLAGAPADIIVTITGKVPRTFATRGTFPYECKTHPGMRGEVTVQ